MIARLRGTLIERGDGGVVIDAGGVGYAVRVSGQTLASLPPPGATVELRTHLHVTDGAMDLFGFADAAEQRAFSLLITVQNVGPKTAMQILSAVPAADLAHRIASGDRAALRGIPGIGPKTAERLIVELREAFAMFAPALDDGRPAPPPAAGALSSFKEQAVSLLIGMGMKQAQAQDAVRRAPDGPLEEIVREALRGSLPR